MAQGVITLLYKGKGSRSLLDSYRPITLGFRRVSKTRGGLPFRASPLLSGIRSAATDPEWFYPHSHLRVAALTVSQPADFYWVTLSLSPAATPPRGPGKWLMPPFIVSHPAFKTLMTAEVQALM